MDIKLYFLSSRNLAGTSFECYYDKEQPDFWNFYSTRQQIGKLLDYDVPSVEIGKIHQRFKLLDSQSIYADLYKDGRLIAEHELVYSFKGLLTICKVSEKLTAPAVSDWLRELASDFCHIGECALQNKIESLSKEAVELRKTIKALQAINMAYHASSLPLGWFSYWQ